MSFHITHRDGWMEANPPLAKFTELLEELLYEDEEHPDVAVTGEGEWCLSVFFGYRVIWENLETSSPKHMGNVSREKILDLWEKLAHGDIDSIEKEDWLKGY